MSSTGGSNAKRGGTASRKSTRNDSGGSSSNKANSEDRENEGSSSRGGSRERDEDVEFGPGSWECTVCTYRNRYEAFKCLMCDTRKGTSTRKPRLNPSVVQQQTLVQKMAVEVEKAAQKKQRNSADSNSYGIAANSPECFSPSAASTSANSPKPTRTSSALSNHNSQQKQSSSSSRVHRRHPIPFRDALVVRSVTKKTVVTVNGVSFTITELKPRTSPRGRKKLNSKTTNNSNNGID